MAMRRPPRGYTVSGQTSANPLTAKAVPPSAVMATPQYWLLFSTASLLATGGMALMSVASPMMQEVFSPSLPNLVTPAAASAYLMYVLLYYLSYSSSAASLGLLQWQTYLAGWSGLQ